MIEAMKMGRLIRKLYLETMAPISPAYSPAIARNCGDDKRVLKKSVPCLCASACFFMFAAGVHRNGTEVFLHRISFPKDYFAGLAPKEADEKYQEGLGVVRAYLAELGVSEKYYYKMLRTPSERVERLTRDEMLDFLTEIPSWGEWLTAKCGGLQNVTSNRQAIVISNCRYQHAREIRREAFRKTIGSD